MTDCIYCGLPEAPRVYKVGEEVIDESGVGGRQALLTECNRRTATGLLSCMERELGLLRVIRTNQTQEICDLVAANRVYKKTVQDQNTELKELTEKLATANAKLSEINISTQDVRSMNLFYCYDCDLLFSRTDAGNHNHYFDTVARVLKHWVTFTFGLKNWTSPWERSIRVAEEAIELAQVEGVREDILMRLVGRIYGRKIGTRNEEVAGVLTTLVAYAASLSVPLPQVVSEHLDRLEKTPVQKFREKQRQKFEAGVGLDVVVEPAP